MTRRSRPSKEFVERLIPRPEAIRDAIDELNDLFVAPHRSLLRALGQSGLWVVSTVIIAAAVNYFVNQQTWWGLVALATLALFAGGVYFYYRVRRRAGVWLGMAYYAEQFLDGHESLEKELERYRRLAERSEEERRRLRVAFLHADEAVKAFGRMLTSETVQSCDPAAARRCLLMTMKFFSSLAQKKDGPPPRCGLLVRDVKKADELLPLIVYSPARDEYASDSRFSMRDDFTGLLLARFEAHTDTHQIENFLYDYIKDTRDHQRATEDPRFVPRKKHHHTDVISILGNVIYTKNNGNYDAQGALNLDGPTPDCLDVEFYRSAVVYQRPMFRMLNALLNIAANNETFFKAIRQTVPHDPRLEQV